MRVPLQKISLGQYNTRHAVLEKIAVSVEVTLKTLKSLSTSRWACRAESVAAIRNNYSAIISALEEILKTTRLAEVKRKRQWTSSPTELSLFLFLK
jgi:hypothetical protein